MLKLLSRYPPTGVNYNNYFINVMSVAVDPLERLWILDNGRPLTPNGTLVEASYGGPKLVAVNTTSNQVVLTIPLPTNAAYPDSYLNDGNMTQQSSHLSRADPF